MTRDLQAGASLSLRPTVSIHEIDPLLDARWDEFVQSHPRSSVFHSSAWLRALRHAYGYQPIAFTATPPGERLSSGLVMCQVRSRLTGNRLVSLPFSDHCEPLVDAAEELNVIFQHLKNAVQQGLWNYAEVRPVIHRPDQPSGFETSHSYSWHVVDLGDNPAERLMDFDKDCVQRRIRRAERESLHYEVGNSEALLSKFYRLFVGTRRRHHLPPQPCFWFQSLARFFGDRLQIRMVSHKAGPVAGILTLLHRNTVTYKYGCSDTRFNNLGGIPLLLWRTILEAKGQGVTQLDLGRSDLDNEGLIKFKDRWGSKRATLNYLRFPGRTNSKIDDWSKRLLRVAVKVAPEWSLIATGRLLYRHIG